LNWRWKEKRSKVSRLDAVGILEGSVGSYTLDRKLEDNEEKVLSRLGITYGVLRRLGFSEERVEECLRAIDGVELEEAFDWVR
jgi:hypothetical protein